MPTPKFNRAQIKIKSEYPLLWTTTVSICAVNDENITEANKSYEYMSVLQLTDGNWREIWQPVDTKD